MDNTPIYIEMCEKAKKIQKDFPKNPRIGDCVYMKGYKYPSIVVSLDEYYDDETWKLKLSDDFAFENSRNLIWLPRQDQLQGMVSKMPKDFVWLLGCVSIMQSRYGTEYISHFNSMEQLWLAFVMNEKFNKIWDGEEWIINE